ASARLAAWLVGVFRSGVEGKEGPSPEEEIQADVGSRRRNFGFRLRPSAFRLPKALTDFPFLR
ncbi:MAG TPA: hypothetical protein VJQ79_03760, partial [Acidimicrobiia bacterium]|nr:hypothetical protein [Acidimicrobiia bacterium]